MKNKNVAVVTLFVMGLGMTACGEKPAKEEKSVKELQTVENKDTTVERVTLASGLAYEVLKTPAADAKSPEKGKQIEVHYTGWLNENGQPGKKFDSSVDRGFPFKFVIGFGQVIEGWDEGVIAMKVGEKRRLYIPSKMGYGAYGAGAVIPPNADLIFDVELLAIK
ncbi:FKBP-type peptidyl-prolyl cis-trans isomerase [Candidatus Dependentiae bacterium]|nr:FKBP-type peptidyl-prolyl cis-trans isomerase [Candidatus Dependentiae bacterium]